jgi:hypothetical protein
VDHRVSREYNDDPVFRSMAPLTTYSSRRRTILVFHDRGDAAGVEALSRSAASTTMASSPSCRRTTTRSTKGCDVWSTSVQPARIGINVSNSWNHADGLTHNEHDRLIEALGPSMAHWSRPRCLRSAGSRRSCPPRPTQYRYVMRVAHQVIAEAFSTASSSPASQPPRTWCGGCASAWPNRGWAAGSTRRSHLAPAAGCPARFRPSERVIQRGDMLHTDFGIVYLGFSTDTQHNAYVLLPRGD